MKIEMAEQMMASYLKNIELCSLVQTNWMPSKIQEHMVISKIDRLNLIINELKQAVDLDFFKHNTVKQFIMQAEIDVVGIKEDDKNNRHVYLVDTAFHGKGVGLDYKDDPCAVVIKKLIRSALIGELFFADHIIHVQFVSPKVKLSLKAEIIRYSEIVIKILRKYNPNINIDLFLDTDVAPLVKRLISIVDTISDDNDLFMRVVEILNIFNLIHDPDKEPDLKSRKTHFDMSLIVATKRNNKDKILGALTTIVADGCISAREEILLTTVDYTQKTFLISSFPFLKRAEDVVGKLSERYYAQLIVINGVVYRVVNQWTDVTLSKFDEWVKTLKK